MTSDDNDTPDDEKQAEVRIDPKSSQSASSTSLITWIIFCVLVWQALHMISNYATTLQQPNYNPTTFVDLFSNNGGSKRLQ